MDIAPRCHSQFACIVPLQSKMRNGMEEVVGSIPTRSTNITHTLPGANAQSSVFSQAHFLARALLIKSFDGILGSANFLAASRPATGRLEESRSPS
jgi:hypothetical protein